MAKILCIPDVHLKAGMFEDAASIMRKHKVKQAVQLGDLVDDWGLQGATAYYEDTIKELFKFSRFRPSTLWCMGNHDYGYYFPSCGVKESGHSIVMEIYMAEVIKRFQRKGIEQRIVHLVDGVLFSHAGITESWVRRMQDRYQWGDLPVEQIVALINTVKPDDLWQEDSPIWARPQKEGIEMWSDCLQVVGHTPVARPYQKGSVLSTDTFSTYPDGKSYGNEQFIILDTETQEWQNVKAE